MVDKKTSDKFKSFVRLKDYCGKRVFSTHKIDEALKDFGNGTKLLKVDLTGVTFISLTAVMKILLFIKKFNMENDEQHMSYFSMSEDDRANKHVMSLLKTVENIIDFEGSDAMTVEEFFERVGEQHDMIMQEYLRELVKE